RNGVKLKVELMAGKVAAGITKVTPGSDGAAGQAEVMTQLQQLAPEQRAAVKQELEHFRRTR
ncbi:MAG: hypothetical protein AAB278_05095, partial [Pseudomonadota bacterium]